MSKTTRDWTAGDLADHCEWLIERGYAKTPTAKAQKTAVAKVFEYVEGEAWEDTNIENLDVDDLLNRFATKARRDFKGQTLATYQGRFRKVMESYRSYMADPTNFRGVIRSRESSENRKSEARPASNGSTRSKPQGAAALQANGTNLIPYPFPLRQGVLAELRLPPDLRPDEATRLAEFVKALAIKETYALPPGDIGQ